MSIHRYRTVRYSVYFLHLRDTTMEEFDPRPFTYFWTPYTVWIIVANFVTLIVVWKIVRQQTSEKNEKARMTNEIIFALAFSDLSSGLQAFGAQLDSGGDVSEVNQASCAAYAFFVSITASQSVYMVMFLGYVRYRILVQRELSLTLKQVRACVAFGWGLALYYASWSLAPGVAEVRPSKLICIHGFGRRTWITTMLSVQAAVLCAIPALVLIISYVRAFQRIKAEEILIGVNGRFSPRVARVGISVVLVYFVTILPWTALLAYELALEPGQHASPLADAICGTCVLINLGINPVLYFAFQRGFTDTLRSMVPCLGSLSTRTTAIKFSSTRSDDQTSINQSSDQVDKMTIVEVKTASGLTKYQRARSPPPSAAVPPGTVRSTGTSESPLSERDGPLSSHEASTDRAVPHPHVELERIKTFSR